MTGASMRVGIACHSGVGGSVRVAVGLAAELARRGHRTHLFARTPPPGWDDEASRVVAHSLRPGEDRLSSKLDATWPAEDLERFSRLVRDVIAAEGLDVLHFHYAVPFVEVAERVRAGLNGSTPGMVMTLHGTDVTTHGANGDGARLGRRLAGFDALTTVSSSHARLSAEVFRFPSPPEVVPNFVDLRRFTPNGSSDPFDDGRRRPRIVHVSNFRPVKEPERVAHVFARVRRDLDAELWLVGDGEGMGAVRASLREAGVERDVRFFGLRRDIHRILPHADVLLLTSRTESFGLVALEAAACGVPVVAPVVGGLPEVVGSGSTGLLFPPEDEAAAAEAVRRLLVDDRRRREMGDAAVRSARRFSSDGIVPRYERVYRSVLDGRPNGSSAAREGSPANGSKAPGRRDALGR